MLDLLWQMGILSAILVFGVKIGLAMGFTGLSKKIGAAISAAYGIGILILSYIITGYTDLMFTIVYDFNFIIFLVLAMVIIFAGFITIREWKEHGKNQAKATCAAMIAPCPCCFGAILAAIVIASPFLGVSASFIGRYVALILSITIFGFYLASDYIIAYMKTPYPILLGNYMLFIGFYFLASAILIPQISMVLETPLSPLNIPSISTLVYVLLVVGLLIGLGIYLNQKKSILIDK